MNSSAWAAVVIVVVIVAGLIVWYWPNTVTAPAQEQPGINITLPGTGSTTGN